VTTYSVKTEVFEGPFDLLLHLVSRQKLDINAISLTEIADEYIEHIEQMRDLDLDVASEFLLLAATLLEIKAASMFPRGELYLGDELDDLPPEEMRSILVERLVIYKQFKNIAIEFGSRLETEGRMHPRQAGLESDFLELMPDYLKGLTLHSLATICADLEFKRNVFLLEAEHVAPLPVSLEDHAESIRARLHTTETLHFSELIAADAGVEIVVVTFLAILELYKRGICTIIQTSPFGDIEIKRLDDDKTRMLGIEEDFDDYK